MSPTLANAQLKLDKARRLHLEAVNLPSGAASPELRRFMIDKTRDERDACEVAVRKIEAACARLTNMRERAA